MQEAEFPDSSRYICQDHRFCEDFEKFHLCIVNEGKQGCFAIPLEKNCPAGTYSGLEFFSTKAIRAPGFCSRRPHTNENTGEMKTELSDLKCPVEFVSISAFEVLESDRKMNTVKVDGDNGHLVGNRWTEYEKVC